MNARIYEFREAQRLAAIKVVEVEDGVGLGLAIQKLGAARAAEDGVRHTHKPYPKGAPGVRMSIQEMQRLIREARNDKDVCGAAGDILKRRGIDGRDRYKWTARNVCQAFLDEIRATTIYSPDPVGTEMIVSPAASLCLRPGLCIQKLDCDDLTVLLCALLLSTGFRSYICKQSWGKQHQEHVLAAVEDEEGNLLKADPSHKTMSVGESVRASDEQYFDPMDEKSSIGVSGSEIVTFGALPDETLRAESDRRIWSWDTGLGKWMDDGPVGLGYVTSDELNGQITNTTAIMSSTNSAVTSCAALSSTDLTAWQGYYAGFQAWLTNLQGCVADTFPSIHTECLNVYSLNDGWAQAAAQLVSYNQTAAKWQQTVKAACPSYQPPPQAAPVTPVPQGTGIGPGGISTWVDELSTAGKVVGGVIVTGVVAYAGYSIFKIATSVATKRT